MCIQGHSLPTLFSRRTEIGYDDCLNERDRNVYMDGIKSCVSIIQTVFKFIIIKLKHKILVFIFMNQQIEYKSTDIQVFINKIFVFLAV